MSNARYGVDDGPLDLIIEESGAGGVSSELAYLPPRVEFGTPEIMIASARAAGALDQLNEMKWRLPRHVWEGIFDVVEVQSSAAIDGHAASLVDLIIDEHVGIEPNGRRGILRAARLLGGTRDGDERLAVSSDTAELLGKRIGGYELRRVGTTAAARELELIRSLLSDWERFSNAEADGFEPLVRVAICHAQFGLIHPFEDGNGLVGRMLLQLHLVRDQCLQVPVCLSRAILEHVDEYHRLLAGLKRPSGWEPWVLFMLGRMEEAALWQRRTIQAFLSLRDEIRNLAQGLSVDGVGEFADPLFGPVCWSIKDLERRGYGTRWASVKRLDQLEAAGVLEAHARGPRRLYVCPQMVSLFEPHFGASNSFPA